LFAQKGTKSVVKDSSISLLIKNETDYAKPIKKEKYKIAVLTPLYLDSIDLEKNVKNIPKVMQAGIDFYEGVEIAADTLRKMGVKLDIHIFDSKSNYLNVKNIIESDKLDSMDVIIGNASVADLKLLADFAKTKKINFVSAVSPADAGQEFNPYFTILQPRLVTHIEKLHKIINFKHPEDNVIFIHRKNQNEQNALGYFKNDAVNQLPSRFSSYELNSDEINIKELIAKLDTNYKTTIVLGILDPEVAYKNLKILTPYARRFNIRLFGMPTLEAVKSLSKPDEFPNMPIQYTSSYMVDKITSASKYINRAYKKRMGTIPSDIVYKGFESVYYFANLLTRYGVPFNANLNDNTYTFITPYKIIPIKEKNSFKFYENKFLYSIKYENGYMSYE
jgi:hypothetical protein